MSTIGDNDVADVAESPAEVTATETTQIKKVRHSPLNITVILPNNRRILIASVNPSEPTSYLKQTLQEYQESAQYTSYTFETADKVTISDYVEIANYGPPDEEASTMVVHLVPAQYDVKKSRLQLKRVREMIAYPPNTRGASANLETGAALPLNVAEETVSAADPNVICPVEVSAAQNEVDLSKEESIQLESAAIGVMEIESETSYPVSTDTSADGSDLTTAVISDEVPLEVAVEVTTDATVAIQPASAVNAENDCNQKTDEKVLDQVTADVSSDDSNSPSNESKDGSSLENDEEKPISMPPPKSIIVLDDDGIKVTGMDAVVEPTTKQQSKTSDKIRKLPSEKSIFI